MVLSANARADCVILLFGWWPCMLGVTQRSSIKHSRTPTCFALSCYCPADDLLQDDLDHRAQTIMCITELPISNSHTTTSSSQRRTAHGQCEMNNSPDSSNSGSVIGVCVLDVSSGHCQAGVFSTADDPARSALAAALLMYDPIECIAVRSSLHSATVTLVVRHCEFKGAAQGLCVDGFGSSSSGCGGRHIPGLSWLPPAATAVVLQEPAQLLQQLLPEQSLQQLQEVAQAARSGSCNAADQGGRTRLAVLSAVAVAVMQLQRCSLSEDVLPTLELSALKGLGKSAAQNPGKARRLCCRVIALTPGCQQQTSYGLCSFAPSHAEPQLTLHGQSSLGISGHD